MREHLVLQDLELMLLHRVGGLRELALVLDDRGVLFCLLLRDLLDEVVMLGFLVERLLLLALPIELDEQVAHLHARAGGRQLRDHHRPLVRSASNGVVTT
jgi:hypothetical protein